MKKLVLFALILILMGCDAPQSDTLATPPAFGIRLSVTDVTQTGLTLVCSQHDFTPRGELQCGEAYELEVYQNENWIPVSEALCKLPRADDMIWHSIAYKIPVNDSVEWQLDWQYLYGSLSPGKYRISKEITDFVAPGDFDTQLFYAEFSIK